LKLLDDDRLFPNNPKGLGLARDLTVNLAKRAYRL
jgi:hypothetical protein